MMAWEADGLIICKGFTSLLITVTKDGSVKLVVGVVVVIGGG